MLIISKFACTTVVAFLFYDPFIILLGTPCTGKPCKNSGTCSIDGASYQCICPTGYYGTICESKY